ncbi:hypothetical protein [Rariglobus hedericola]|uniref:hypothetical protein n=1 Tax=Rariglobus hedericola TaxID=2597822 RepID=UPI001396A2DC|nr:hypothetical protein [Rariglobus hedericola]
MPDSAKTSKDGVGNVRAVELKLREPTSSEWVQQAIPLVCNVVLTTRANPNEPIIQFAETVSGMAPAACSERESFASPSVVDIDIGSRRLGVIFLLVYVGADVDGPL